MIPKALLGLVWTLLMVLPAQAQLNRTFENIFKKFLEEGFEVSPGDHANHYLPAASEANSALAPALNSLIAGNIASFPISSSVAGVTFDFSTGQPVAIQGSLGPIFAENAETLGGGQLLVGFSATHLGLDQFRGVPLEDMRFTFLHQDLGQSGLGDNPNESDVVDITLGLNAEANIFALYARYGVTSNFDVSLAIPFVDVSMEGKARATVESFTFALGAANHFFEGDSLNPALQKDVSYKESAAGIGNIALQLKYRLPLDASLGVGALIDVRVPTGDEGDFLGTGSASVRGLLLLSRSFGTFNPHLNIGYDYRNAAFDSDELEVTLGFDQKLTEGLTFALDFLGEFDLQKSEAVKLLPGAVVIVDQVPPERRSRTTRIIKRSNIPDQNHDHTINAALGLRIAPTDNFQILGNLIVPLQNDGLRSDIATTLGLALSF